MKHRLLYHSISPRGLQWRWKQAHDNRMSKQFVNNVASVAILATCWHEVPLPPLEGEVPNECEAEGFVRVNPSVSLRLPAPLPEAPLAKPLARSIQRTTLFRQLAGICSRPYRACAESERVPFIERHPLSFALRVHNVSSLWALIFLPKNEAWLCGQNWHTCKNWKKGLTNRVG